MRTVATSLTETSRLPSGLKATLLTALEWPCKVRKSRPAVFASCPRGLEDANNMISPALSSSQLLFLMDVLLARNGSISDLSLEDILPAKLAMHASGSAWSAVEMASLDIGRERKQNRPAFAIAPDD